MAERYQVRGLRIWDSHWDMYSGLYDSEEAARDALKYDRASYATYKPLSEWQDEKPESKVSSVWRGCVGAYGPMGKAAEKQYYVYASINMEKSKSVYHVNRRGNDGYDITIASYTDIEEAKRECNRLNCEQDDKPESDPVEQPASDPVNHPDHYQGKVECIDAIEAALGDDGFVACCRGNAMKYIYRAGRKGDSVEDLRKAAWYLDRAIKTLEK